MEKLDWVKSDIYDQQELTFEHAGETYVLIAENRGHGWWNVIVDISEKSDHWDYCDPAVVKVRGIKNVDQAGLLMIAKLRLGVINPANIGVLEPEASWELG